MILCPDLYVGCANAILVKQSKPNKLHPFIIRLVPSTPGFTFKVGALTRIPSPLSTVTLSWVSLFSQMENSEFMNMFSTHVETEEAQAGEMWADCVPGLSVSAFRTGLS